MSDRDTRNPPLTEPRSGGETLREPSWSGGLRPESLAARNTGNPPLTELTDEHLRILIAIDEGRMTYNQHGRYVIEDEERPDRKSREQLRSRGLAVPWYTFGQGHEWRLTATGRKVMRAELDARIAARRTG